MKKLSNILSLSFVVFFLYYLITNPEVFNVFKRLDFLSVFLLIFIKLLTLYISALFNKRLIAVYNINLSNRESLYVASITYLGNLYFPARVGAGLRLAFFKQKYKVKNSYLVSNFAYFFVVSLFINSLFGLTALLIISNLENYISIVWFFIFFFSFGSTLFLLVNKFELKKAYYDSRILQRILRGINSSKEGWNKITQLKGTNFYLIIIYIFNYLLFLFEIVFIFYFLNEFTNIVNLIFYNSISVFSNLIGITPSALGIKEFLLLGSTNLINLKIDNLIQILLIERAVSIIFSVIPLFISFIFNKSNK